VVPGGGARTSDPSDILRRAKAEVPDITSRYGITELRPRRTATGDILLEIPGADASRKADDLAAFLRKHARDVAGVRVVRPVRRVELRIAGLDSTVTPEDVAGPSATSHPDAARRTSASGPSGSPEGGVGPPGSRPPQSRECRQPRRKK